MTYRYSRQRAYFMFALAVAMLVTLYATTKPMLWGWLLFLPLFVVVVYQGVRAYKYSLTIDGDRLIVDDFKRDEYPIPEITAINVWVAKGGHIAVVTFAEGRRLSFPSSLVGFDDLVELLRKRANLAKSAQTSSGPATQG